MVKMIENINNKSFVWDSLYRRVVGNKNGWNRVSIRDRKKVINMDLNRVFIGHEKGNKHELNRKEKFNVMMY